jgi:hypothetical protein
MKEFAFGTFLLALAGAIVVGFILGLIAIWQNMRVWVAETSGRAEYAQAEQNRKITVLEAQAANEAATQQAEAKIKIETANASAEVERAKGVAEANKIIADSLRGNESYLHYLWIQKIAGAGTIYVPTEAGLPILEAGKR